MTEEPIPPGWRGVLAEYRWLTYVLPFAVFMLGTSLEPSPPEPAKNAQATAAPGATAETPPADAASHAKQRERTRAYQRYPLIYSLKILATLAAITLVWPGYRAHPWRVSPWSVVVGVVGLVIWIALTEAQRSLAPRLGIAAVESLGTRAAYNPLEQLKDTLGLAYGFLAVRFLGLALVVPLIEEFFLRGFILRFFSRAEWWQVPFGQWDKAGVLGMTALAALSHPAELLAAVVWFSLVTWLMLRTRNIWDCVVAHAVTNLLLGVYVVATGRWYYW